jgi:glutathionyl-hydroquinone reductase
MDQQLFNIAVALVGALGGWWMNTMWQSLKDLQKADRELADKVSAIEILVAGEYVKREAFDRAVDRIFEKLDQIDAKLDKKADK